MIIGGSEPTSNGNVCIMYEGFFLLCQLSAQIFKTKPAITKEKWFFSYIYERFLLNILTWIWIGW